MNKTFILPTICLSLSGCGFNNQGSLKIVAPTGAPALAFYFEASNKNFETNSDAKNIIAEMTENGKDIVVLPSNAGINAIKKGAPYKLASIITFGNFFIAATGKDDDSTLNEGDTIVLFNKGNVPDLLFHYIYGDQYNESIEYVANAQLAAGCLSSGINVDTGNVVDYVFIAEPAMFATLNDRYSVTFGDSHEYINVQEKYKEKSQGIELVQACVFVKNSTNKEKINNYLSKLKTNIEAALANPDIIENKMSVLSQTEQTTKYGVGAKAAVNVSKNGNRMGLGYKAAFENKTSIDNFISLFGLGATDEEIYYK